MAQCYITTYRDHFRWNDPHVVPSAKPFDKFMTVIPPEDIWTETKFTDEMETEEEIDKKLHKCYLKRLITSYRYDFCKDLIAQFMGEQIETTSENQLLKGASKLYEPESRPKIAPPLAGSRKVFGYIRPTKNYTPWTNYQLCYGRTGYDILKGKYQKSAEEPAQNFTNAEKIDKKAKKQQDDKKISKCDCCGCKRIKK